MAKLTFLGATGTVTGSRFQLEIDGRNLLIDCGLFQGLKAIRQKNWEEFPVSPASFDYVLLTHAHIDHSGYLPKFVREGFKGGIVCTHATAELCEVMLTDSANIQEEDAKWANKKGFSRHSPALPLYTTADAQNAIRLFQPVHYGDFFKISDTSRLKFHDSGHILGSALIDIKTQWDQRSRKILFSGDLGRPEMPILNEPDQVYNVDYLILESTYGNRLHESSDPVADFIAVIERSMQRGGSLIIPAFSVGRAQTLLYLLRLLEEEGKIPSYPIFVDSPMAIEALTIFEEHIRDLDLYTRLQKMAGKAIFRPQKLHICRSKEESISINQFHSGCIIISASGMVTGGRILHHLAQRLPDERNTVLLIGFQAEGTRGRTIQEKKDTVKIHGREIPINAHIEMIDGFSGHADYNEMLAWLMPFNQKPKCLFLVHGEADASQALADKIRKIYGWKVEIPEYGDSFDL